MQDNRPLPALDERLSTVFELVSKNCTAADIGCDHGKLAAALSCKCKKVIAVDSRPAPLQTACELMRKCNLANVECRLGDGINALSENEADTIIVAGLSAKTICDIITAAPWVKAMDCRLILVPATKPHELRTWLYENGFYLIKDIPVKAAGKYYAVLCAEYSGEKKILTPFESVVGELCGEHKAEYLKKEAAKLLKASQKYECYKQLSRLVAQEAENDYSKRNL